jgi:hypothetical protein
MLMKIDGLWYLIVLKNISLKELQYIYEPFEVFEKTL